MALYSYQAFSRDGKKITGAVDAASNKQVRDQLVRQGLYVVTIQLASSASKDSFSIKSLFERSVTIKDKIFFTKQLGVLLRSGVPVVDALSLLSEQTEGQLKNVVVALRDNLQEGKSLADGLASYPKTFESIYIQLVRAGEASGRLETILERLTLFLERQQELRQKIKKAMMQPMIQLVMIVVAVFVLVTFVVPQIGSVFAQQGMKLPGITTFFMNMSGFFRSYYYLVFGGTFGAYIAYRAWRATPSGARVVDGIKLKLPVLSYFARMGAVVQFSRTLGMLLEGGVSLAESLDIVSHIVDNRILIDTLEQAREQIIKQGRVAEYLKKTELFPPMAIYLINTGEQSGRLDAMLNAVADNYERELIDYSDGLVAKLNPILLLVMAAVIGTIVAAIMAPLLNIGDMMQRR